MARSFECQIARRSYMVFGNTVNFLCTQACAHLQQGWLRRQDSREDTRQVLTTDAMSMTGGWEFSLQRFYWRAKTNTLHTNAVKHRMDARWSGSCPTCVDEMDTQDHRFGLVEDIHLCEGHDNLTILQRRMHHDMEKTMWQPDQCLFIPALGQITADQLGLPARPMWGNDVGNSTEWKVMVNVGGDLWVHALLLNWLGVFHDTPQLQSVVNTLLEESNKVKLRPAGRLVPFYLTTTIQELHGLVGLYDGLLSQWTPGWATATLADMPDTELPPGLCNLHIPEEVPVWWVDDIYIPRPELWWQEFCRKLRHQRYTGANITYWIGTYADSPGFESVKTLEVIWILRIPAGKLKMRTDFSVIQRQTPAPLNAVLSRNCATIWIGVVGLDVTLVERMQALWAQTLHQWFQESWLVSGMNVATQPPVLRRHPIFDFGLPGLIAGEAAPVWWHTLRQQLDRLQLAVYYAPKGWRRYPTMDRMSMRWAESISYTKKQAKAVHYQYFRRTWEVLRDYWNGVCVQMSQARTEQGVETLWRDVNRGIQGRRQQWTRNTQASTNRLLEHRNQDLVRRAAAWHQRRNDFLAR